MPRKRTVVIGRDEQLELLDGAVSDTGDTGSLIMVRGPGGSGKSALLDAAEKRWSKWGVRTFSIAAVAAPRMFDVLFDAVRLRIDEQQDVPWPPGMLEAVAACTQLRPRDRKGAEHNLLPFGYELTRALAHLAHRERIVVLIEDVDRLDRKSALALSLLVLGVRAAGIVVITTGSTHHGVLEQFVRSADVTMDLPPLRNADIVALLSRWAGMSAPVDPTVTNALLAGLGPLFGNPGTVRSTLRALRDEGRLVLVDEHVCLRPAGEPVALADDHELLAAVRDCGPGGAAVVWGIAVLGEVAVHDLPMLAVAADTDLRSCGRVLDRLVRQDVVRDQDGVLRIPVPALGVALGRAAVRPPRTVHAAIVRYLLDRIEDGAPVDRAVLAHHSARAESEFGHRGPVDTLIDEADRMVDSDTARAADWYRAAVHRLVGADRRWAGLLPTMLRLQLSAGRQHELADDLSAVASTLLAPDEDGTTSVARSAYPVSGDALLFEVTVWWGAALLHEQRIAELRDSVRVFEAVAVRRGCADEVRRFSAAVSRGESREVFSAFSALITAGTAEPGTTGDLRVHSLGALLSLMSALDGDDNRFQRARAAWEASAPGELTGPEATCLRDAVGVGDYAAVLRLLLGRHYQPHREGALHRYHHVVSAYHSGDWDTALSEARALETGRGPTHTGPTHHLARVIAAEICSARGDFDRAERWLHRVPPLAYGHLASWARCGLLHRKGRTAEAVTVGRRDYERYRDHGTVVGSERLLARLIDYSLRLDDDAGARGLFDELRALDERVRTGSSREMVLITGGALHADVGSLRVGVELARQRGDAYRVACGCAVLGALADDPQPWLHEGYALTKRFGSPVGRGVFTDLMRASGVAPPRSRSPRSVLSTTESTIIDLVSDGYTNRQIAIAMQVSVKTVESRLTRLFDRTDCRSRVELAAARLEGRLVRA
ncbi:DNA-binding CsgD family transcriptional regulator [Saccharopolyspora lacisalsi]|uniref:DNA-binding CsgD family transcriptional regulator n=1 Tax=Halosaccharopolyspora lacisalsi TaxID=1000566 RepID=A0A839DW72_9PSEU|nr:LuxR family transcriptional regulator [Halosaccharopolyspora lacisalsi]MBA8826212.1 DNA-binding CsgD family transcriptional regulator [Halosaccharopolyspora lacisalsi]